MPVYCRGVEKIIRSLYFFSVKVTRLTREIQKSLSTLSAVMLIMIITERFSLTCPIAEPAGERSFRQKFAEWYR